MHTCFGYESETRGERNLVTFEDKPVNNHKKRSHRELSVDMIILTEVFCNARQVRASLAAVLTAIAAAAIRWLGEGGGKGRGTQH